MCFGGGGSSQQATPIIYAPPTKPVAPAPAPPPPVSRTYKPLFSEMTSPAVRQAGTAKRRSQTGTVRRQSLSTGASIATGTGTPAGGINL